MFAYWAHLVSHSGVFVHNAQTGYGRICYEVDNGVYCGECVEGKRHGQVCMCYKCYFAGIDASAMKRTVIYHRDHPYVAV